MAIKPTPNNNMFKSLVFDGVDSRDYGIYITGDAVFNSPERDVEMIEIPGRNGAYALDKGRFSNIKVSYPAGIAGDTEADFREGISAFRNALASRKGYKRLEDDYNPDEYRMAVYKSGLEVTPKALKAGEFTITFDCKPQRFLKSGETAVTIGGDVTNTKTESGSIVSIEGTDADKVTSLVAQITPVQAGSGDPSPTNVRAITGHTSANVTVAGKNLLNANLLRAVSNVSIADGIVTATRTDPRAWNPVLQAYKGNSFVRTLAYGIAEFPCTFTKDDTFDTIRFGHGGQQADVKCGFPFSVRDGVFTFSFEMIQSTGLFSWHNMQIELGTTATAYEPYHGTTYPVSFGSAGTVYGGTVDVVTGVLTVTHAMVDLGTLTWIYRTANVAHMATISGAKLNENDKCEIYPFGYYIESVSSLTNAPDKKWYASSGGSSLYIKESAYTDAASFKTAMSGRKFIYTLATPQTHNLTAQEVELLTGQNHVWADTGDTTLTYGRDPNKIVNPTLYNAHPLLSFTASGAGTININNDTISVTNQPIGDIVLANVVKLESGESVTWTDTSRYLTGDAIRIDSIPAVQTTVVMDSYSYANYTNYISDDMDYLSTASTARGIMIQHSIPSPPQFVAGTARSVSYTARVIDKVKHKTTGDIVDCTTNLTVTIAYDGAHSITATTTVTASLGTASTTVTIDTVTVNSTKPSLTGTAYIDLDIGEAYSIDGGAVVSINDSVSLGASLPVLKPSTNTISKTGSVANLTIIPRWWEL